MRESQPQQKKMKMSRLNGFFRLSGYKLLLLALITCGSSSERSIYLIPEDFEGNILIVFDQKDGISTEYEHGLRVYKIPDSGVLRTKFKPNYGTRTIDRFYYVSQDGQRTELKYFLGGLNKIEDEEKSDVICFNLETGNDNNSTRHFLVFSVAQVQNIDSVVNERSSFLWRVLDGK